jgi:hypothetical protein
LLIVHVHLQPVALQLIARMIISEQSSELIVMCVNKLTVSMYRFYIGFMCVNSCWPALVVVKTVVSAQGLHQQCVEGRQVQGPYVMRVA